MKAYVTNSNAKSIIYKLDVDSIDTNQAIYKIDFRWFSNYEVKSLLAFKLLFQNPEEFFKKYKRKKAIDKKEFVFEGHLPSHHNTPDCERLLANFFNYKIPDEIKSKGDNAITEFREWFKEHMYLMEDRMDFFLNRMKWKFDLKERPKVVDYKNSGAEQIESMDLETLEKRIELLIKNANNFYTSNHKHKVVLDNFGRNSFIWREKKSPFNNNTNYTNEQIWEVLKEFEETYKTPIANLLREYYRVKFNPELEFEGCLLEQLGFQPCRKCYGHDYISLFDDSINRGDLDNSSTGYSAYSDYNDYSNYTEPDADLPF
jgi:hypothetical protein